MFVTDEKYGITTVNTRLNNIKQGHIIGYYQDVIIGYHVQSAMFVGVLRHRHVYSHIHVTFTILLLLRYRIHYHHRAISIGLVGTLLVTTLLVKKIGRAGEMAVGGHDDTRHATVTRFEQFALVIVTRCLRKAL